MTEPLTRSRSEACLSDLILDRIVVGELADGPEAAAARAHLEACRDCAQRLEQLEQETERFPAEAWLPAMAERTRRAARRGTVRWAVAIGAAAAAAAAVLVALPLRRGPEERIKGGFGIEVIARHHDGRIETILPGAALMPAEAIRFQVSTDQQGFLVILGVDATQAVTAYVPTGGPALALAKGRKQLLEGSIILDEAMGAERLVAILCPEPFATEDAIGSARRALQRAAGDPQRVGLLDMGCRQASFLIEKVKGK